MRETRILRRRFLSEMSAGALLATLGSSAALNLGLVSNGQAETTDKPLQFGDIEPLVSELQETPVDRLQPALVQKLKSGTSLKTLVSAAALANARTFGGEDYIGFHTFMALAPAFRMARLMPQGSEALPVLKVAYRNSNRIQAVGGRQHERLHSAPTPSTDTVPDGRLYESIRHRDSSAAERLLAAQVAENPLHGLDALLPSVQDTPEVHRTVLPFRAWEMVDIVGTEHALTLLRQSLNYCLMQYRTDQNQQVTRQAALVARLFDEFKLEELVLGTKPLPDPEFHQLADAIAQAPADEAARAVAASLADGFDPAAIGEALSLAANLLVLRDGGRLPQFEDRLKPPGCVHGDSVGVHASDAANAWRNLARICTGKNRLTCLLIGSWQIANDRTNALGLMANPLPAPHHVKELTETDPNRLLNQLDEAIRANLQGHATAITYQYGQLGHDPDPIFRKLVRYAVSEDGALHAEKYFQTVWDGFHSTRTSVRWRHLMGLARVTASEYGTPAAGQAEAQELVGSGLQTLIG